MNRGITPRYNQERINGLLPPQTEVPNGVGGVGFDGADIDDLVTGALLQQRLLSVSPREVQKEDLHRIYLDALRYW